MKNKKKVIKKPRKQIKVGIIRRLDYIKKGICPKNSCHQKLIFENGFWKCPVHMEKLASNEIFNDDDND